MSTAETPPRLTLLELAGHLPKPPADAHEAHVGAGHEDEFTKAGADVATERVLTDCRRLYAEAYFAHEALSKEQRADFVGFTPELLAYAVACAVALDEKNRAFDQAAGSSKQHRASADADLEAAHKHTLARRDQGYSVLKRVASGQPKLLAALDAAVGSAETDDKLAQGTEALGALAAEWLAEPKTSVVHKRLKLANVTAAYPKTLAKSAADLREAAAAAAARGNATPVTQQQLDHDDGLNLFLLGQIVDAFDSAHDLDPAIPRLIPQSTRRQLRPTRAKKQNPPTPAPEPVK